ncbi:MAG TPA: PocR ligand-binding domain-containing protein, partial [Candidatus Atribacteria bacterium]|nr:PocR ligand-binding domain-containing protein [Candidatus Atribacteria bacterium]
LMRISDEYRLEDIIDIKEFMQILNSFITATGYGAVFIDANGESALIPSTYGCEYCKIVQSDPEGRRRCMESMNKAGRLAAQIGEPYISRCHAGLIEFAAPIVFKDIYLGSISCGPVLLWECDDTAAEEFIRLTQDLNIDHQALLKAGKQLSILSGRAVQAAAELLFITTNHICHTGIITLQQRKELNEQQSKLAEIIFEKKKAEERIKYLEERAKESEYPIDRENELLSRVRMGDRTGAKEILNELLGIVFLRSGGNMELIKARVLELVIVISRAAVEGGAQLDKLLGLNYSFVSSLSGISQFEEICSWTVNVLNTFLDTVYESRNIKNARLLSDAMRYINENYNRNLTLESVAQHVYISPFYLSHMFKEELGFTFLEYLTKLRIEEAKKLLMEKDMTIIEVASEVGYEDAGYFSKVFKKYTGISPAQYRKNNYR